MRTARTARTTRTVAGTDARYGDDPARARAAWPWTIAAPVAAASSRRGGALPRRLPPMKAGTTMPRWRRRARVGRGNAAMAFVRMENVVPR